MDHSLLSEFCPGTVAGNSQFKTRKQSVVAVFCCGLLFWFGGLRVPKPAHNLKVGGSNSQRRTISRRILRKETLPRAARVDEGTLAKGDGVALVAR
jgi:hypothetical protein